MAYKLCVSFLFFFFLRTTMYPHTVYVSICEVYVVENKMIFSFRVFKNDIFDALKIKKESFESGKQEEDKVINYLKNSFYVKLNEKKKNLSLDQFRYEGEGYTETINVKFSFNFNSNTKEVYIKNNILFDFIDEQMNVVSFNINNTKKTLTFKKPIIERWIKI